MISQILYLIYIQKYERKRYLRFLNLIVIYKTLRPEERQFYVCMALM